MVEALGGFLRALERSAKGLIGRYLGGVMLCGLGQELSNESRCRLIADQRERRKRISFLGSYGH